MYVWLPKKAGNQKNVGHASLLVAGRTYISWWPDESAGLGRDFNPIRNRNFQRDVHDEGGMPDRRIDLDGLNEKAILEWWSSFGLMRETTMLQGPLPAYNLAKANCSTVVALALKTAGADQHADWYSSWSVVWRPATILDYALAVQKGLAERVSSKTPNSKSVPAGRGPKK